MQSRFSFLSLFVVVSACEGSSRVDGQTSGGDPSAPPSATVGPIDGGPPAKKWPTSYPSPAKGAVGGAIACYSRDGYENLLWVWHVDAQSGLAVEPRSTSSIAPVLAPHVALGSYITSIDASYAFAFYRTSGELVTAYVTKDGPSVELTSTAGAIAVSTSRIDTGSADSRAPDVYVRTGDGTIAARSIGSVVNGLSLGDDVVGTTIGAPGAEEVTVTYSSRDADGGGGGIFSAKKKKDAAPGSAPELRRLVSGLSDPRHLRVIGGAAVFLDRAPDGRTSMKMATIGTGENDPPVTVLVPPTKGLSDFTVAPSADPKKLIAYAMIVPSDYPTEASILRIDLTAQKATTFKEGLTALRGVTTCGDRLFWTNSDASVSSAPID
jgi:hypothetical protein